MSLAGHRARNHPQQIAARGVDRDIDDRATTADDFLPLATRFGGFTVDVAAWVRKAWTERDAECIVMLLPANRTEQGWWRDLVEPYRDRQGSPLSVEFIAGRLRFLKVGQSVIGANERPPFGCCLLIWQHTAPAPLATLDLGEAP